MSRRSETIGDTNRAWIIRQVERAPVGYMVEIREPKRSDDQNRALWSLLGQIARARPFHNGVRMFPDTWKAVFMQALGAELVMIPTLDGTGLFPIGHRSSRLTKDEFSNLLTLIIAWADQEGIELEHFDTPEAA